MIGSTDECVAGSRSWHFYEAQQRGD